MSWTDERVALLKKLWCEGKTAKEIAQILGGGVTRNAVIGKAHRLKLSNRVSPIQQNEKIATRAPVRDKSVAKQVVRPRQNTAEQTVVARPIFTRQQIAPNAPKGGVKMADLKERMCRWPHGDPRDADFHFCGAGNVPGLPYCEHHCAIAFHVNTRKTVSEPAAREEETLEDLVSSVVSA